MAALMRACRPRQWPKNLFVFGGLIFANAFRDAHALAASFAAFVCFCALSSAVYLINDVAAREGDRHRPATPLRPSARGEVSVPAALWTAAGLSAGALAGSAAVGLPFFCAAFAYWALMLGYTFHLKRVVILDIFTIAAGFVLRAVGGAVAIPVPISAWLLVCTMLVALFLALGKRRAELTTSQQPELQRESLSDYSVPFIDQMVSVVTAATAGSHTLYAFRPGTASRSHGLLLTVPFVLYGIFRYLYLIYQKDLGESPDQLLVEDRPLLVTLILWAAVCVALIWSR